MIANDFPCETCGHWAQDHYVNISSSKSICTMCSDDRTGFIVYGEQFHDFVGDNLKYTELKKRKQELLNGQD